MPKVAADFTGHSLEDLVLDISTQLVVQKDGPHLPFALPAPILEAVVQLLLPRKLNKQ